MLVCSRRYLLPLIITLCLSGGCGHPVQETAAHKIADALPQLLGPAARYDVQVDGDPFALSRGRAQAVHIQGLDVQMTPTVTLDTLRLDATDVSFDKATRQIAHIGGTAFMATMSQEHLTEYLAHTKLLPGLVVTLRADDLEAQVPVTFLGLHTTAKLSGNLRPDTQEPNKLDFTANGAQVGILPLPAMLINLAAGEINPLLDLSGLKAPVTVDSTTVSNGVLTLRGQARLESLADVR